MPLAHAPRARRRRCHRTAAPHVSGTIFVILLVHLAAVAGCNTSASGPPPAPPSDEERARALVDHAATLPPRAEVVALADAVAIASSRAGRTEKGASLARLAADLRTRAFRLDQAEADAREALELYAASASAAAGTEAGCEADRRRALLSGELTRDASAAYREIYLASRRQAVLAPRTPCHAALERSLALASAFRPRGELMSALEREGNGAAESASRGATAPSAFVPVAMPSARAVAEPATSTSTPLAPTTNITSDQVVVTPRDESVPKGPVKITSIEPFGSEKGGRVVIHLSGPTTFQVGTLGADAATGKDARVFVDITRATARGIPKETEVAGVVRRVRLGAQESGTRVVLDLAASLYRRVFYLPDPFRIVVDVSTRAPGREDKQDASGRREVRRIVLDPGHGGNDTGAVGPTGLKEKDVTLDIAHRAATVVSRELGIETLLTRDDDTYVPLDLRTARANAFHADLFVSIHCNASENGQARGPMTFSLDRVRDPEGLAMRIAARENAPRTRSGAEGDVRAVDEEMALIVSNLNVGDLTARSRHVADLVQRAALASLGVRWPDTKDQGTKTAGFFVLVGADMPAVLFETSFISNPEDETRLATADYRQKLADAVTNAIRAYREGK